MKCVKRIACCVMVFTPLYGFSLTETVDGITWTYTVANGVASVGGGAYSAMAVPASTSGTITIPSALGGYIVKSIEDGAFSLCSGLTSVTIPDSVTSIGSYAFYGYSGLMSFSVGINNPNYSSVNGLLLSKDGRTLIQGVNGDVTIPEGVTSIGASAFRGCSGLTSVTIPDSVTSIGVGAFEDCSGLVSVTIPDSVTSVGEYAFIGCSGLMSLFVGIKNPKYSSVNGLLLSKDGRTLIQGVNGDVTIPDSVTSIGVGAFYNCSGLTSVTIPDSVRSIGDSAFSGCSGLTSVTIGNGVTSVGDYAFSGCSGLTSVTIGNGVTSIGSSVFSGCSGLTSVAIPDSVTSIEDGAFSLCSGLTSVTIPDSVTSIGGRAFYNCNGLTSVTIPDSVTSIGSYAFYGCSSLASVTIPDSVTSIGDSAFSGCSGLTSVTIPDSVTSIGSYAFYGCSVLMSFSVGINNLNYSSVNGLLLSKDGRTLIQGVNGDVTIPEGVTSIGSYAFYNCSGLTSVTIPDSVTSIGSSVFSGCSGLADENGFIIVRNTLYNYFGTDGEITIPDGVTNVGSSAFYGCSGPTNVTIPDSVTSIGERAFYNCNGLTSVTIPDSVTSIGSSAFSGCSGLTNVTIPDSVTSIGSGAFSGCSGLTSVTIPDSVTSIGSSAFFGCSGLTSVTIPDSVTSIGSSAFEYCSGLTSVTIPDSVTNIGSSAFEYCSGLTHVTIPDSVTSIGSYAFYGCSSLASVTIPDSVTSIGDYAFSGCSGLTSVTIPDSVTSIEDSTFEDCSGLNDVAIPQCVCDQGMSSVFPSAYQSITNVVISGKVTNIGERTFDGCIGLTSVTIPQCACTNRYSFSSTFPSAYRTITNVTLSDNVTSIGDYAFSSCTGLTSVVIPNSVTSIAVNAFSSYMMRSITSVTIPQCVCTNRLSAVFPRSYQSITNVVIADGVRRLWLSTSQLSELLSGCSSVKNLTIPYSVRIIGTTVPGTWNGIAIDYTRREVTFKPNYGAGTTVSTNVADGTVLDVLPAPTRENYVFCGWFKDSRGGEEVAAPFRVTSDIALYAHWVPVRTVKFEANGGICALVSTNVANGTVLNELPMPIREHAMFLGWFTDVVGGSAITAPLTVTSNSALYAHWLENPTIVSSEGMPFRTDFNEVSISCATKGVSIYYTDDGTTPKKNEDYLYTGPFTITDTTTIKAVAVIGDVQSEYVTVTITKKQLTLDESLDVVEGMVVATGEEFPWTPILDSTAKVGDATARSGEIGNRAKTWLSATVSGSGTMSFWYKVSCEHDEDNTFTWDRLMVYTNDVEIADWRMDGDTDWTKRTLSFDGGENTVKWVYYKDKSDTDGEDCAWVDGIEWTPSGTADGLAAWLAERSLMADARAANGRTAAECYALGLDPADATNDFRIVSIEIVDGEPKVEWEPKVNRWTGAEVNAVLKGAAELKGDWKPVEGATAAEKAAMRFFKVVVVVQ